ncbi:MAG: 2-isopropylmalate synthase, partial [Acidobacteriota bacterium]|nr:2-isopropylmalate synthase [Acidobacteriota bacterium]
YEIMRPESVGAAGTRLVLGKHSGLRGLDARCRDLGHRLRQAELERLYVKVTALADRTKTVDDAQLTAIIRDEMATAMAVGAAAGSQRGDAACH